MCSGFARVADFAHLVDHAHHEPILLDVIFEPSSVKVPVSRRSLGFDRLKLQDPEVVENVKAGLAKIVVAGRHVEQSSRCHIIAEAVRGVLQREAPKAEKKQKQTCV